MAEGHANTSRSTYLTAKTTLEIAVVALAYLMAAHIGLALDAVSGFATLVWPAGGIALAAILLGGFRLWPAIAIGAFLANLFNGASPLVALGIAVGNTAEAVLGAWLIRRTKNFHLQLDRVRDVLVLLILAAVVSTVVAATVGVTTLLIGGVIPVGRVAETWRAWWIGDAMGDLLVAPLILVWAAWKPRRIALPRAAEAVALVAAIVGVSLIVFGNPQSLESPARAREYMLFPPLIWAALRFGLFGSVTSAVLVTIIAVAETVLRHGPFVRPELHDSLLALQTFMGVSGATFLFLGASMSERERNREELKAARENAEAANRAKSGFLAMISHELRTPLNAITGFVDVLSLELDGPLTDKQRDGLSRIAQNQRHLLSLIEDVLGFAQVEAGRLSFALQPVNPCESIATVETIVAQEVGRKGLNLIVADCDVGIRVLADPDKLRQIVLNLVTNAIKFTPRGGEIRIRVQAVEETVRIAVADTGIGIPEDKLDYVCDPFFQVEQGDTRRYPGVGLGLSIVRDVVLAMNGEIAIESELGKGTTVTINLPRDMQSSLPEPRETAVAAVG